VDYYSLFEKLERRKGSATHAEQSHLHMKKSRNL
jgi:hypothetical protein